MGNMRQDKLPGVSKYHYKITSFKGLDAVSEDSALGLDFCKYGYNIGFSNGALVNGPGIGAPAVPLENGTMRTLPDLSPFARAITKIFHYRKKNAAGENDDRLIAQGDDGLLYQCNVRSGIFQLIEDIPALSADISFLNYYMDGGNKVLICKREGGMYIYDGTAAVYVEDAPGLTSVCMHYDRLFGTDGGDTVYFSRALDPSDWDTSEGQAGYIKLMDEGGNITKVLSFKDHVYLFREHSVYRLTAYTDPKDYSLSKVFLTNALIYPDTVAVYDNNVFFLADNDLYVFDGYSAKKLNQTVTGIIKSHKYASAAVFKNKYYLSVMLKSYAAEKIGDEETGFITKNNGMLVFDLEKGEIAVFRGTDLNALVPLVSGEISLLLCTFHNYRMTTFGMVNDSGRLFDMPLHKLFVSPSSHLGNVDSYKVLRRMYIGTLYPVTVSVTQNGVQTDRAFTGGTQPFVAVYNTIGDTLKIKIDTQNDKMYIHHLKLELDFSRRYYAN